MNCSDCSLIGKPKVMPTGNPLAPIWFIGEAPGEDEEAQGIPFCGKSGNDHWRIMRRYGIRRDNCYATNVLKCRPPDNNDPAPEQIAACRLHLEAELAQARPGTIIVALGRFALNFLLPWASLAKMHGIPQPYGDKVVVPAYHPAAGLHQPAMMINYQGDMKAAAEILDGKQSRVHEMRDPIPHETSSNPAHLRQYLNLHSGILSMDTELYADGSLYLISLAVLPELAYVIDVNDSGMVAELQRFLDQKLVEITMHYALVDIPWSGLNFDGLVLHDTVIMAHLLQRHPLKLKHLAYRLLGLDYPDYSSLVDPVSKVMVLDHVANCLADRANAWPPTPKGSRRKTPWKRVAAILKALCGGLPVKSVLNRWNGLLEEYPAVVRICGPRLPLGDLSFVDRDVAFSYTAQDAGATYQIHHILMAELMEAGLLAAYYQDMAAMPMVLDMNSHGVPTNRAGLLALGKMLVQQLKETRAQLPCNPMSGLQVAEMLREQGLDTRKRTKSGNMSTDKKSLTKLKGQCAEITTILEYREALKLNSAYVEGILENLEERDSIWELTPNISMTRVPTGRLACSKPNIMAMPYRTDQGVALRYCFYAPAGCVMVSLDYSQIELRVMAHESQDGALMDAYRTGKDVHSITASRLFSKPIEALDYKKERYPAKTVNFLIIYGGGASNLRDGLREAGVHWGYKQCADMIGKVKYEVFPGVGKFLDKQAAQIRRTGESRDLIGRRRLIPQIYSTSPYIQEEGIRQGINNIIQSGAQSIIKKAMAKIQPICVDFQQQGYICYCFLQMHDELIFIMTAELAPVLAPLFQQIMVECGDRLTVPVEVDYAVGPTWGDVS